MVKSHRNAVAMAALVVALAHAPAYAQSADDSATGNDIIVTGTRIKMPGNTSSSPIASTSEEQIKLQAALTIEDFSTKLPQLSGGVRQGSQGSDAFGAQVLELRNFGQSRTLVLIDGTRGTPFGFRNSMDVNSIPASLIKRVDVLTGGAAAVYGADAVAGVVNFILNDDFEGVRGTSAARLSEHGGAQYGGSVMVGTGLGDRGHVVVALDYTQRDMIRAGQRDWATTPNSTIPSTGGVYTDVASGNTFGFTDSGAFTDSPASTSNISSRYPLTSGLKRINAAALFKYELTPAIEVYGRAMFNNSRSTETGTVGATPVALSRTVSVSESNPYLTDDIRNQLTFVNGTAQVNVSRSLNQIIMYHTDRDTFQAQTGLRGALTSAINWNVYAQYGRSTESTEITGDGLVNNASGVNNFATLASMGDIFSSEGLIDGLTSDISSFHRKRDQFVTAGTLSGTSEELFSLPAGPIGFAAGVEYRRETASIGQDSALLTGNTYKEGVQAAYKGKFDVVELYGEVLIPVLHDLPLIEKFDVGGAYRLSKYDLWGTHGTWKMEANWKVDGNLRVRGTFQRVLRTPNFGEFAGGVSSLPFSNLVTVDRLKPRYGGDPCVLGTGDAAQCARFGAPAVGSADSTSASYLTGNYYYGGNPDLQPETGKTKTIGAVFTPTFLPGFNATLDWYEMNLKGAVGVIQPIAAITSCYITNPSASNPLCALVTRNEDGTFKDAYVNNQNLGRIVQRGFDISATYTARPEFLGDVGVRFSYQGNIVTSYTIQANATVSAVQCKGTFGATCSSDGTTLVQPDYRHTAGVGLLFGRGTIQFDWQRIGKVKSSAAGSTETISAQNTFDLSASREFQKGITMTAGIYNLFDKNPPYVSTGGVFNTFPDTYDILGRTFGFSLTAQI
ncbi:TonB-dependent receptor domain-containing protein [Novosphingobium resinovorum]|uniref:TonB-dependent receptor domain-containing protein n=1 Tax=Novosphingobium resinovorum TaxID=158500 RepID=UPI002ED5EB5F|nr:TonB-dependent receptor [Novosphingobium resinovorum]